MKVLCVAGARPNFMKLASLTRAMVHNTDFEVQVVHTGQHYDERMSKLFFDELALPEPDAYLDVRSGSHGVQLARIIERFEALVRKDRPDVIVVVGDVNSTLAAGLVASREKITLAHVEAGLRSGDRDMPEEVNRVLTDAMSDFLFVTEAAGMDNLVREGIPEERCYLVGNTMIDTLLLHLPRARQLETAAGLGLSPGEYGVVTLHRPSNVDCDDTLEGIVEALGDVAQRLPLAFPIHPRTRQRLEAAGLLEDLQGHDGVTLLEPLGYLEFLSLQAGARLLLTDSGGIQEEAVILEVRCLTLRENTERPSTIEAGVNTVIGVSPDSIRDNVDEALEAGPPSVRRPEAWDGQAGERVVGILGEAVGWLGRR